MNNFHSGSPFKGYSITSKDIWSKLQAGRWFPGEGGGGAAAGSKRRSKFEAVVEMAWWYLSRVVGAFLWWKIRRWILPWQSSSLHVADWCYEPGLNSQALGAVFKIMASPLHAYVGKRRENCTYRKNWHEEFPFSAKVYWILSRAVAHKHWINL